MIFRLTRLVMVTSLFPCLFLLLLYPLPSIANIRKANNLLKSSLLNTLTTATPPSRKFEVTKPIKTPNTKPCVLNLLQHDFAFTYGHPPAYADYTPPSHCSFQQFSTVVLDLSATVKGRQYDRIFGVWLSGVELLRSCTSEPTATGVFWNVQKDITRYHSLLVKNETQKLAVFLGNYVDNNTYTGVYHVNISMLFYPAEEKVSYDFSKFGNGFNADMIVPISRNLPLNDGLWFEIGNSNDIQGKEFSVPGNVYRASLEVYVSFHENDEFWYSNLPNEYIVANNLTSTPGNGPFREVLISVDGDLVGSIWPFTVVYTGGINPLFWSPITGIGSFDLPSYDIELTPYLERIMDGKTHKLGFSVTNALNVWYIDANLHLWLDHRSKKTEAKLLKHDAPPPVSSTQLKFKRLNGRFSTSARRSISSSGWVRSSYGKIFTNFFQHFSYNNTMEMGKEGDLQIIDQMIGFNESVSFKKLPSDAYSFKLFRKFCIYLGSDYMDQGNNSATSLTNLTLGYYIDDSRNAGFGFATNSLKNQQDGRSILVVKNNTVRGQSVSMKQTYRYDSSKSCYFRNISATNTAITYDHEGNSCERRKHLLL